MAALKDHLVLYWFYIHNNIWSDKHSLDILDSGIKDHQVTMLKKIEENNEAIDAETNNEAHVVKARVEAQFKELIPNLVWSSSFLSFYAFLEHSLGQLVDVLRGYFKIELRLNEVSGNGVERCKLFITKVCKVEMKGFEEHWRLIGFYNKVRNVIIHQYSELDKKHKDFKSISEEVARRTDITFSGKRLTLTRQFCDGFLDHIDLFYRKMTWLLTDNFKEEMVRASESTDGES